MKTIQIILFILFIVVVMGILPNLSVSDDNMYVLHTKKGDIKSNYFNSRDDNNGWLYYYDYYTKKSTLIQKSNVDSVTVLSEDFWTCGPRSKTLKYIDKRLN